MLTQLHIILTYVCNKSCDHCFVYCSPEADPAGTFTLDQLDQVIQEAKKIGTIELFYFEGGEPFLFYPILMEAIKLVKNEQFKAGIVTNGYWATSEENTRFFLKELKALNIDDLSVSDDCFHMFTPSDHPRIIIEKIGAELGVPVNVLTFYEPDVIPQDNTKIIKGEPITGGNIRIRGRAAEKLTKNMPLIDSKLFNACGHEELVDPMRVHLDAYGYVHICQGISIGNMWEQPLSKIILNYKAQDHPIVAPLLKGGPLELANSYQIPFNEGFIESCHMCYEVRKVLRSYHPELLQPIQVYNE